MSFAIFLQGFRDGASASGASDKANRMLRPFLCPSPSGSTHVITEDGGAEVNGVGTDALMFTNASGHRVWDVIFEVARAGTWAIIPVGCPTCVPTSTMIAELPDELRSEAIVVESGADIVDVVRRS